MRRKVLCEAPVSTERGGVGSVAGPASGPGAARLRRRGALVAVGCVDGGCTAQPGSRGGRLSAAGGAWESRVLPCLEAGSGRPCTVPAGAEDWTGVILRAGSQPRFGSRAWRPRPPGSSEVGTRKRAKTRVL